MLQNRLRNRLNADAGWNADAGRSTLENPTPQGGGGVCNPVPIAETFVRVCTGNMLKAV
jgi:hypothetical protein